MTPEVPLQRDMFTGELVDTRTARQKNAAAQDQRPQQTELFSSREIAQFGVTAKPLIPLTSKSRLALIVQDSRTAEEIERDFQQAAEAKTHQLFGEPVSDEEKSEPLNELALICLEALHQTDQSKHKSVDYYLHHLWTVWSTLRDEEIAHRANRIWALNDEATLKARFEQLSKASAFSFPVTECEPSQEAWYAAWQFALEDIDANPPTLPTFSRGTIKEWLEEQ